MISLNFFVWLCKNNSKVEVCSLSWCCFSFSNLKCSQMFLCNKQWTMKSNGSLKLQPVGSPQLCIILEIANKKCWTFYTTRYQMAGNKVLLTVKLLFINLPIKWLGYYSKINMEKFPKVFFKKNLSVAVLTNSLCEVSQMPDVMVVPSSGYLAYHHHRNISIIQLHFPGGF